VTLAISTVQATTPHIHIHSNGWSLYVQDAVHAIQNLPPASATGSWAEAGSIVVASIEPECSLLELQAVQLTELYSGLRCYRPE